MAISFSHTLNLSQFQEWALRTGRDIRHADWTKPLKVCRTIIQSHTKLNFQRGQSPDGQQWPALKHARARGGSTVLRDRGLLMASSTSGGQGTIDVLTPRTLTWGTNLPYAALHQFGGTIRPRSGQALAIPLTREAVRKGSPRNWPKGTLFFFQKNKSKPPLLAESKRNDKLVFHYVLMKSVTIPARPFLGVNEAMASQFEKAFDDYLRELIERS